MKNKHNLNHHATTYPTPHVSKTMYQFQDDPCLGDHTTPKQSHFHPRLDTLANTSSKTQAIMTTLTSVKYLTVVKCSHNGLGFEYAL